MFNTVTINTFWFAFNYIDFKLNTEQYVFKNNSITKAYYTNTFCEKTTAYCLWENCTIVFTRQDRDDWYRCNVKTNQIQSTMAKKHAFLLFSCNEFLKNNSEHVHNTNGLKEFLHSEGFENEFINETIGNFIKKKYFSSRTLRAFIRKNNKMILDIKSIVENHLDMQPEYFYFILTKKSNIIFRSELFQYKDGIINAVDAKTHFYTKFKNKNRFCCGFLLKHIFDQKINMEGLEQQTVFTNTNVYEQSTMYYKMLVC